MTSDVWKFRVINFLIKLDKEAYLIPKLHDSNNKEMNSISGDAREIFVSLPNGTLFS
jgi:hypothetical protein